MAGRTGQYRPTPTEIARLATLIPKLRRRGYAQTSIAEALGVSPHTVSGYLTKAGITSRPGKAGPANMIRQRHDLAGLPPLGTIDWRDAAQPPVDSTPAQPYHLSLAARAVRDSLRHLREINGVVRMAYDVTDAKAAQDTAWVNEQRTNLSELADYIRRLAAVIDDEELRHRARVDHGERDDLRTAPRLVVNG